MNIMKTGLVLIIIFILSVVAYIYLQPRVSFQFRGPGSSDVVVPPLIVKKSEVEGFSGSETDIDIDLVSPGDSPFNILQDSEYNEQYRNMMQNCPSGYKHQGGYGVSIPYYGTSESQFYGTDREQARKVFEMNYPHCRTPDVFVKDNPESAVCPFVVNSGNPCNANECSNVDWSQTDLTQLNASDECKASVRHYCGLYNSLDPQCICWHPSQSESEGCITVRGKFENPYDMQFCPDMRDYVRKDNIPCWGCDLSAPVVEPSAPDRKWWNPKFAAQTIS